MGKMTAIFESFSFSIVAFIVIPSVLVGIVASGSLQISSLMALVAAVLIGINVNIINNYSDWRIDIVNGKKKLLHRGVSKGGLLLVYLVTLILAAILLYLINSVYLLVIVAFAVLLGILYSSLTNLKDRFPLNHFAMALGYGILPFLFGFFSGTSSVRALAAYYPLIAFLFVACFGYSMTKDYGDITGDSLYKKNTMPVLLGKSTALKVQQASIIAAYALLLAFVVLGLMSPWFLLSSVSLVAALAIMNYVKVNKDPAILKRANMYNRVNHLLLRSVLIVAMLLI